MAKKTPNKEPPILTVDYAKMGTMTIDELKQALWADLQVLKEHYAVKYINAPKLKLQVSDEFGEAHALRGRDTGKPIYRLHTCHYRPACMDYDFS